MRINTPRQPGVYAYDGPAGSNGETDRAPSGAYSAYGSTDMGGKGSHTVPAKHVSQDFLIDESDGTQDFSKDENEERGNWTGRMDFLLSCLGYAVGLGNVWRFPYMCYRNGGGAFLVPYVIFLVFVGMPVFLLDLSLGQFTSNGPTGCWEMAPLFTGVGYAMMTLSALVAIYYNMIIAYSLYYMFASMASPLPWESCENWWNTHLCRERLPILNCTLDAPAPLLRGYYNGTCYNGTANAPKLVGIYNESLWQKMTKQKRVLPAQEYWNNKVFQITDGIHDIGPVQWELLLCLLASWIIVFLCMIKGIKSSGKVVYFTALFPYLVLVILFFRGVTLDGAGDGLYFYLVPDFQKLSDPNVWKDAANQIFFSLSASWGGLMTLASYNRFHNDVIKDTFIVSIGNCGTSVFAGFVIFSFLGYMAKKMGTTVGEVADKGMGLAFIVYPEAVSLMPGSTLWAILFFIMLLTLGLDSQFTMLETVVTSVMDKSPRFRERKTLFILAVCIFLFILGIPITCKGGPYWLQLMDNYCGGWGILTIGLFECIIIGWVYGRTRCGSYHRFSKDIQTMVGKPTWMWWRIMWQFISPTLICFILIFAWVKYSPAKYGDMDYPVWADGLGWCMTLSAILCIPGVALYKVFWEERNSGTSYCERFWLLTIPSYKWGPALPKHRRLCVEYLDDPDDFYLDVNQKIRYGDVKNQLPKRSVTTPAVSDSQSRDEIDHLRLHNSNPMESIL